MHRDDRHLAAPRLEMRAELGFAHFVHTLTRDERLAGVVTDVAYCGLRSELSDGAGKQSTDIEASNATGSAGQTTRSGPATARGARLTWKSRVD